jgi:hypothetical protein
MLREATLGLSRRWRLKNDGAGAGPGHVEALSNTALPIVLMLHGAGANENTYIDQAGGLLPKLAE